MIRAVTNGVNTDLKAIVKSMLIGVASGVTITPDTLFLGVVEPGLRRSALDSCRSRRANLSDQTSEQAAEAAS